VSALAEAVRMAKGIKPVTTMRRDLMRTPLSAMELNRFDCVVFDPPRVGALAQVGEIARSRLATAIAVSCNPGTFARDARALMDGGFQLLEVVPVDQFLFSSHIEIVALFRR
jgi:23S rRNA (uracil1939-C5)-methyltransferase